MVKRIAFGLFVILGFAFVASAQEPVPDKLTLRVGQQKNATRAGLRIKFLSVVEDSRCPKDVNCIWAGNAQVKLLITDRQNRQPAKTVVLNTNIGPQSPQSDRFYVYSIALVSLSPERTASGGIKTSRYRLNLTVTRFSR